MSDQQTLAQMVRAKYPGVYDSLSDQDLEAKVKAKYPGVYDHLPTTAASSKPQAPQHGTEAEARASGNPYVAVADFGQGVLKGAGNTAIGLGKLAYDYVPGVSAASDAVSRHVFGVNPGGAADFDKARQAFTTPKNAAEKAGYVGEQIGEFFIPAGTGEKAAAWLSAKLAPMVGQAPRAIRIAVDLAPKAATEAVTSGGLTAAQGGNAGTAAALAGAAPIIGKVAGAGVRAISGQYANPNQAERAAALFGASHGVPIDAATASGSSAVRTAQKMAGASIGGAPTAERFAARQTEALTRVGDELAAKANAGGRAVGAVEAGEGVRGAITKQIEQHAKDADAAYEELRQIASRSTAVRSARPGEPFQRMEMPVNVRAARDELRPLYEELKREKELTGVLQGDKGRALIAMDRLMTSDDFVPLVTVDGALSDLKALVRGSSTKASAAVRGMKTPGQRAAGVAAQKLDEQVMTTAAQIGGPDAVAALQRGRAATVAKYQTAGVLDALSGEPGQAYRALTANKDASLETLRAVQKVAPKELPNVARAYLEGMMEKAGQEGGFGHADKLWSDWNNLGKETKAMLFPDVGHRADISNFLFLAKQIADKGKNTSQTAYQWRALNLTTAAPMYVLSKMLYSPQVTRQLMTGIRSNNAEKVAALIGRFTTGAASQATQ